MIIALLAGYLASVAAGVLSLSGIVGLAWTVIWQGLAAQPKPEDSHGRKVEVAAHE